MTDVTGKFEDLRFDVIVSVKYHARRRRFFESVQNTALFVAFLFTTASVLTIVDTVFGERAELVRQFVAVSISAFLGLTLVGRCGSKAADHNDLKQRFIRLQQEIEQHREQPTQDDLNACWSDRLEIERAEPPINRVVQALCYNETVKSLKRPEEEKQYVTVKLHHRLLGWATRAFDDGLELAS